MQRPVLIVALIGTWTLFASPLSAQTNTYQPMHQNGWFLSANVGPSFGTLGSAPLAGASAGYNVTNNLAIVGEFGFRAHAPIADAAAFAPPVTPLSFSNQYVNTHNLNANLLFRANPWGRLQPYATAGFGEFASQRVGVGTLRGMEITEADSETNPAWNLGFGAIYRLTNWFGINADYRHFIVNAANTEHVNRFTTGVSLFIR